jgi:hypothetical protein
MSGSLSLPPTIQPTDGMISKSFKGTQGSGSMTLKLHTMTGGISLKFSAGGSTSQSNVSVPATPKPADASKNLDTKERKDYI